MDSRLGAEQLEGRRVLATSTTGAPFTPSGVTGAGGVNYAEEVAGFTIRVPLASSGAVATDNLILLSGASTLGTTSLQGADIAAGYYDFSIVHGQLSADGSKSITATVTGGGASLPLTFLLDTLVPSVPTVALLSSKSVTPTIGGTTGSGAPLANGSTAASTETMTVTVGGQTFNFNNAVSAHHSQP